jgi:hypothetical protein
MMEPISEAVSQDDVAEVLRSIRTKRVRLWAENGELHYKAPRGVLSHEDVAKLKVLSGRIVRLLEASSDRSPPMPALEPRRGDEVVPLTFSQLQYWRKTRLSERGGLRTIVAAHKLRGPLDVPLLRACISELVMRHEALRTRIVLSEGVPEQRVLTSCEVALDIHDLASLPEPMHDLEVERRIHELMLAPVRVDRDPLFAALLVKLGEQLHVLVMVMEHVISDGFSRNVLVRDLVMLYGQRSQGHRGRLPPLSIQFADYAVWQAKAYRVWLHSHGSKWQERFAGCRRIRFQGGSALPDGGKARYLLMPVHIDSSVRERLTEWCRIRRTTPSMAVFTAFAALVLRWCGESGAVIGFQSNGRFHPLIENSIGYFAYALNLRLELRGGDSFVDLLRRVMQEYCIASEHADLRCADTQVPLPEFARNPGFNWVSRAPGGPALASGASELTFQSYDFALPTDDQAEYDCDFEPSVIVLDKGHCIEGYVRFPNRYSIAHIEAFRESFLMFVREWLRDPEQRIEAIPLTIESSGG